MACKQKDEKRVFRQREASGEKTQSRETAQLFSWSQEKFCDVRTLSVHWGVGIEKSERHLDWSRLFRA